MGGRGRADDDAFRPESEQFFRVGKELRSAQTALCACLLKCFRVGVRHAEYIQTQFLDDLDVPATHAACTNHGCFHHALLGLRHTWRTL